MKRILATLALLFLPVFASAQFIGGGGSGGSGTVTSVSTGTVGSLFSMSVANGTTTPAISLNFGTAAANCFLAGPTSGGAAVPTCRAIVGSDVPTLNQNTTGNAATATALATARTINGTTFDGTANITITAAGSTLSDTVTVAKGGTGRSTLTANNVLLGNTTTAVQMIAPGTSGNVLTSDGTTWASSTPAAGGITSLNTLSSATQIFAVGTTGTDFAIVSSGTAHTFNIPTVSATARGLLSTSTDTIAGVKTFTSSPSVPGAGAGSERFGLGALAAGATSAAFGPGASAAGLEGTALGSTASSSGSSSVAVGSRSVCGTDGVAVGFAATSGANGEVAIGKNSSANGGVAIGPGAIANGVPSIAVGNSTTAAGKTCIALGRESACTANQQFVMGANAGSYDYITDVWIGNGVTATTPQDVFYHATGGSGSNVVGASHYLDGGISTGTAAGGNVYERTSPTTQSSGSTANTIITRRWTKGQGIALTSGAAASVVDITLATLAMSGGSINFTIVCSDGTDMQAVSGIAVYSAVNKGGAYTTSILTPAGTSTDDTAVPKWAKSVSAGTITTVWSILNGTNKVTIQVTSTTSLTATSFKVYINGFNNSEAVTTPL